MFTLYNVRYCDNKNGSSNEIFHLKDTSLNAVLYLELLDSIDFTIGVLHKSEPLISSSKSIKENEEKLPGRKLKFLLQLTCKIP